MKTFTAKLRSFNFRSVRSRLTLLLVFVLLVPTSLIGFYSYESAQNELKNKIVNSAVGSTDLLNEAIAQYIQGETYNVESLAVQLTSASIDQKSASAREVVDQFTKHHPEIELITLGNEKGNWMKSPDPGAQDYDPRTRDWYKAAKAGQGKVVISDPYVSVTTKNVVVTVGQLLPDGQGVIGANLSLSKLAEIVKDTKIGSRGYVYIFDRNSKFIFHPNHKAGEDAKGQHYAEMLQQEKGIEKYVLNGQAKEAAFTTNALTGWKIVGTMEQSEIQDATAPILYSTVKVILIALLVSGIVSFFIIRSITQPLRKLANAADIVSQGDLTETIAIRSKNEIGMLAVSFNRMTSTLRSVLGEVQETANQLAASSEEMTAGAEQTAQASEHITMSIQDVSADMEKQTQSVSETARAMEEMTVGIQRIAESASNIVEASDKTKNDVQAGNVSILAVISRMETLQQSVEQLAQIIFQLNEQSDTVKQMNSAITNIAMQTNLLSLNASIEAARAGEHGRGFAVVASEVQKLADQTRITAQNIHEVITEMAGVMDNAVNAIQERVKETQEGLAVTRQAEEAFRQIQHSQSDVMEQIQEVSAITEQMSASTEQMAATVVDVADISKHSFTSFQNVSAASEEQLASMEEMRASSEHLSRIAEQLQRILERFKV